MPNSVEGEGNDTYQAKAQPAGRSIGDEETTLDDSIGSE